MAQQELQVAVAEKEQKAQDLDKCCQELETARLQNEKNLQGSKQAQAGLRIANTEKDSLVQENNNLNKQLQDMTARMRDNDDTLIQTQTESKVMETKMRASAAVIKDLESQLAHANTANRLSTERVQLTSNDGNALRDQCEGLALQLSKKEAALRSVQKECDELKKKMAEMELDLELVRKQLRRAQEPDSESTVSSNFAQETQQQHADKKSSVQVWIDFSTKNRLDCSSNDT